MITGNSKRERWRWNRPSVVLGYTANMDLFHHLRRFRQGSQMKGPMYRLWIHEGMAGIVFLGQQAPLQITPLEPRIQTVWGTMSHPLVFTVYQVTPKFKNGAWYNRLACYSAGKEFEGWTGSGHWDTGLLTLILLQGDGCDLHWVRRLFRIFLFRLQDVSSSSRGFKSILPCWPLFTIIQLPEQEAVQAMPFLFHLKFSSWISKETS